MKGSGIIASCTNILYIITQPGHYYGTITVLPRKLVSELGCKQKLTRRNATAIGCTYILAEGSLHVAKEQS